MVAFEFAFEPIQPGDTFEVACLQTWSRHSSSPDVVSVRTHDTPARAWRRR